MPAVSSVGLWRNRTHHRSSCPPTHPFRRRALHYGSKAPDRLQSFLLCTSPLPVFPLTPVGTSLSLTQFHSVLSQNCGSSSDKGERNHCPWFEGILESSSGISHSYDGIVWLSLPCPDKSVDSLRELFPSNNSRVYFPLSASVGFSMWSQIWFIVLPAFSLSRLSSCFSLSKQMISFQ